MRAGQEVLFVDSFQRFANGVLDKLVLEHRDPNWPSLTPLLRNVDMPDRLMAIMRCIHRPRLRFSLPTAYPGQVLVLPSKLSSRRVRLWTRLFRR